MSATLYERCISLINGTIVPVGLESFRLLPDSIVLGTAILALLSMCKSYGILVATMIELMLIQRFFGNIFGGISPIGAGPDALHQTCQPGFTFPNAMRISLIEKIGMPSFFPSPVMFFISGIISYMVSSMNEFKREITVLGGDLAVRNKIAIVFSFLLIFLMLSFRFVYGCESFGTLFTSVFFGGCIGLLLKYQNENLFGRDSINILNLPMIQTSEERGKPMFVCSKT
jgi:hypothetical protein